MLFNMLQSYFFDSIVPAVLSWIPGIVMFFVGWWAVNKIARLSVVFLKRVSTDSGVVTFLNSLIKFSLRIVLVLVVMSNMGFKVDSIIAALAASLVAIGISLKDSLSNIVSGIVLVINKPIHVGDTIEFDGSRGTVMRIEMLFTTLKTEKEGKTVIIPNARLISNTVVRESEYDISSTQAQYKILGQDFSKESMRRFLEKEFVLNSTILQIPHPEVTFAEKSEGESSLMVKVWAQTRHTAKAKDGLEKIILKLPKKYGVTVEALDS